MLIFQQLTGTLTNRSDAFILIITDETDSTDYVLTVLDDDGIEYILTEV